jgi:hypothetical protein
MRIHFAKRITLTGACILGVLPCHNLHALVVDSFTQGPFYRNATASIDSLLGTSRSVTLGPRTTPVADTLQVTADASQGSFTFYSYDTTPDVPWGNLYIQISYNNTAGIFDASPYTAFAFDFTDLVGTGDLVVEIGFGPSIYRETTLSTPITEPGWLAVPMEAINYSTRGGDTLSAFSSVHFTFRATSPTFGFTLNEIALTTVPEPASAAALLGATVLAAATLRRKRRGNRYTGI